MPRHICHCPHMPMFVCGRVYSTYLLSGPRYVFQLATRSISPLRFGDNIAWHERSRDTNSDPAIIERSFGKNPYYDIIPQGQSLLKHQDFVLRWSWIYKWSACNHIHSTEQGLSPISRHRSTKHKINRAPDRGNEAEFDSEHLNILIMHLWKHTHCKLIPEMTTIWESSARFYVHAFACVGNPLSSATLLCLPLQVSSHLIQFLIWISFTYNIFHGYVSTLFESKCESAIFLSFKKSRKFYEWVRKVTDSVGPFFLDSN